MIKQIDIICSPKEAAYKKLFLPIVAKKASVKLNEITASRIIRKSIDARSRNIKINLRVEIAINEKGFKFTVPKYEYKDVSKAQEVVIIGAGPAGLFAALRLIELGLKPVIFERGKNVSERKRDLAIINRKQIVNPESNYCFGEGGAGTFSDGKLYTRSRKRGDVERILNILYNHGADENILFETHPHIGTNKLPRIIKAIRETILNSGGEVHFNSKLTDIFIKNNQINAIEINNSEKKDVKHLILATGHSARDIYELLHNKSVKIESKDFAMGVRVEHPQNIIDSIQYKCSIRSDYLPAASYSLVKQVKSRGVYSFCMCPGGFIVPAATNPKEIVVNGMSPSMRNSKYANSGMVVEIKQEDLTDYKEYGVLAGLKYQENLERLAYINGGGGLIAPAQALEDFVKGRISSSLPDTSYHPGVVSSPLHHWLPENIGFRLQEGFKLFNRMMKGYVTNKAIVIGVESRTSSPVRIPRDRKTLEHTNIKGIYPCGEGAGYAGGIVSAAVDGENVANSIV